jgi:hypothetical protein
MAREEESVKRRRLARSTCFLAYIREYPEQFLVVKRTREGKAVPVGEKKVERLYEEGCKVVVVPDPGQSMDSSFSWSWSGGGFGAGPSAT